MKMMLYTYLFCLCAGTTSFLYGIRWTIPGQQSDKENVALKLQLEAKQDALKALYVELDKKQSKPTEAAVIMQKINEEQDAIDKIFTDLTKPDEVPYKVYLEDYNEK